MRDRSVDNKQTIILIVDDQAEELRILTEILEAHYHVKVAHSCKDALEIARTEPPPNMILHGAMMPGIDGLKVLERLVARSEATDIPVIPVTAGQMAEDGETAFAHDTADCITKPIQPSATLARVRRHLALKRAHNELARQNSLLEGQARKRAKELQEYQHQLLQTEKMAAIGLLAGGIAHDFNNILTPIIGYCELIMDNLEPGNRLYDDVHQIFLAGLRAKDLVDNILTFARKNRFEKRPVRVGPLAKETLKLLQASLPAAIELRQEFDKKAATAMVYADPSQLQSIVMDLCTNAAYAMCGKEYGMLSVSMAVAGEEDTLFLRSRQVKMPALRLQVSDTGSGLNETIRRHIFDPYFTTKPPGEGRGLGLSVVYGIVMDLHGAIDIKSQVGAGSVFTIYLPLLEENPAPAAPVKNAHLPKNLTDMLVMLIDDDETVLTLGQQVLKHLGMRVETYSKSDEALTRFFSHPNEFGLVITNQSMPKLSGAQLAKEITAARPGLPVLLCTGSPHLLTSDQLRDAGISLVLPKPIHVQVLIDALRQLGIGQIN